MKAITQGQLKADLRKLILAIPKAKRCEMKNVIYSICEFTKDSPEQFFITQQGKHWQAKKQLEVYCLEWRSTGEQVVLTQNDMAKHLKITPRQVAYRCSAAGGKYSEARHNPEIGNDDIMTLTKFMLQPGEKL